MAILRVSLGLIGFLAYLLYLPDLEAIFGLEGLGRYVGGYGPPLFAQTYLWQVYVVLLIAAASFTVGLHTRLSGIVLIACHLLLIEQGRYHTWGWSRFITLFVAFTVVSAAGARFSVDALLRARRGLPAVAKKSTTSWGLRLIQITVVLIYLSAGWSRLDDPGWWRGEMVYEALAFDLFSRFPGADLQSLKPLLWVGSHATWLLELLAPLLLSLPRTRTAWVVALMVMHLLLQLTSTVGWWQWLMISVLVVFLPDTWTRGAIRLLRRYGKCLGDTGLKIVSAGSA